MPTFTVESELATSAEKIWQTLKDAPEIIPKVAPHAVASIEHVDGPKEGVGAVRLTKLGSAAPPGSFLKEKLVAFDPATFTATTEEIEGGHLAQGFTKWVSFVKFVPISDSSCKWSTTVDYDGENEAALEAGIARAKEGLPKMIAGLVAYINNNA
jgi:hypothetical protein